MIYDPALYERERERGREEKKGGRGSDNKKKFRKLRRWATICHLLKVKGLTSQSNWNFFFLPPQRQFGVVVTGLYGPLWTFREREREEKNKFGVRWKSPGGVYARSTPTFLWREVRKKKRKMGNDVSADQRETAKRFRFQWPTCSQLLFFNWQNLFTASSLQKKIIFWKIFLGKNSIENVGSICF